MQSDVSSSKTTSKAVNQQYNLQLVYVESSVTHLSLPAMANLHGPVRHLPTQSGKSNIIMS